MDNENEHSNQLWIMNRREALIGLASVPFAALGIKAAEAAEAVERVPEREIPHITMKWWASHCGGNYDFGLSVGGMTYVGLGWSPYSPPEAPYYLSFNFGHGDNWMRERHYASATEAMVAAEWELREYFKQTFKLENLNVTVEGEAKIYEYLKRKQDDHARSQKFWKEVRDAARRTNE